MEPITKEEYEGWLQDSVTRKILNQFEKAIRKSQETLGQGTTLDENSAEFTLARTSRSVGYIEGLNQIFKIDVE